jgi:hypothetical protein
MLACATLSGCLWPTSLTDEVQAENNRPVFASSDPVFGPLTVVNTQVVDLKLQAQDPNPDKDTNNLYVRLFRLGTTGPTSRIYTFISSVLTYPPGTDIANHPLTPLSGSLFPPSGTILCSNFDDGDELFVVVADRPFSNELGMENTAPGGLTSENHWTLRCQ